MFSEAVIGALGVVGGALLTGGIHLLINHNRFNARKKAVSLMFYAEISNIIKACKFWKFENDIENCTKCIENSTLPGKTLKHIDKNIAFRTYYTYYKDIGILPLKEISDIVLFYGNMHAVLDDIEHVEQYSHTRTKESLLDIYQNDLILYNQAIKTGEKLLENPK